MAFVPVENTAMIEAVYSWDGQIVENTLYYKNTSTPGLTELAALTDAVRAYIVDQLLPALTSAIQLVRVVGTLLDVVDGLQVLNTTSLPIAGEGGAGVPNNVSLCVSFKTANRGRSARGRNFIPGLPTAGVSGNTVGSTLAAAFETAYTGFIGLGGDDGWSMVVVSRYSGFTIVDGKKVPTPREAGVTYEVTNTTILDRTVDSQRRRLPGRGT